MLALLGGNGAEEETVIESVNEGNMMSATLKAKVKEVCVLHVFPFDIFHTLLGFFIIDVFFLPNLTG